MSESNHSPVGTMLVQAGLLNQESLDVALAECDATNRSLGRVLLDRHMVTEGDLLSVIAKQMGMEYVDLADFPVDVGAVLLVPAALARKYNAIPVQKDGKKLLVAMQDPANVFAVDDIRSVTGCDVRTAFATGGAIADAINKYYRADSVAEGLTQEATADFQEDDALANVKAVDEDAPIIRLVNVLIEAAVQDRASDIHVEPTEKDVLVRFRVDGVLHLNQRMPKNIQMPITSRLKIMAEINIAERRIPQSGRISWTGGGKKMDLRVESLPTQHGEKIVMRLLDNSTSATPLDELGFLPTSLEQFKQSYAKPYGTILVTGPTGSGKSTTLYSTLNILNDPTKNIITVENPIEYTMQGINQVAVNDKAGMTFPAALRSILRCDPDIVMVGEIRDAVTADIAIEAALTGHLVLSTLHTNDASSTPTRLVEMGIEPFLVASALDCVVAQRLPRRLCERCREAYEPTEAEAQAAGWDYDLMGEPGQIYRPGKCGQCGQKGYRGRFAVHEVLTITEEIEKMIIEHAHTADIQKVAVAQGMIKMKQAGLIQVKNGISTFEEILRVIA